MKRIVISGYYGSKNFGDEAILERLTKVVRQHPDVEIVVFSNDPDETARRHGVSAVSRKNWRERVRRLAEADLLVFGGGGLIKGNSPRGWSVGSALIDSLFARILGIPSLVFEVGVGPIQHARSWAHVRHILSHTQVILLRDSASKRQLLQHGVPSHLLHDGADVLFALNTKFKRNKYDSSESRPTVLLNLVDSGLRRMALERPDKVRSFLETLVYSINDTFGPTRSRILLVGFQDLYYCQDLNLLQKIGKELAPQCELKGINLSDKSLEYGLSIFRQSDFVVGMRFHSIVLALLSRVPFLALNLTEKVANLMHDLNAPELLYDLRTDRPDALPERLTDIWLSRKTVVDKLEPELELLHERACKGERLLLDFLDDPVKTSSLVTQVSGMGILFQLGLDLALEKTLYHRTGLSPKDTAWKESGPLGTLVRFPGSVPNTNLSDNKAQR